MHNYTLCCLRKKLCTYVLHFILHTYVLRALYYGMDIIYLLCKMLIVRMYTCITYYYVLYTYVSTRMFVGVITIRRLW